MQVRIERRDREVESTTLVVGGQPWDRVGVIGDNAQTVSTGRAEGDPTGIRGPLTAVSLGSRCTYLGRPTDCLIEQVLVQHNCLRIVLP